MLLAVLYGGPLCAAQAPLRSDYAAFAGEMAAKHGLDEQMLRRTLGSARVLEGVLRAMQAPSTARPWHAYMPTYVNAGRIGAGVQFWRDHEAVLARARQEYGVPEEIIVATIGVETFYGRNTGSFRVIDALVTLAFDYPRRAAYFRSELEEFLLMARQQGMDPLAVRGSYAGAMGVPQFMPSSFRRYAVDFNGDGRIRFQGDAVDAIGSVANYYRAFGWQPGRPVAVASTVEGDAHRILLDLDIRPQTAAQDLPRHGVRPAQSLPDAEPVTLFTLEGGGGTEYWIGLNNFYVITRYNRSVNYAMSVYLLASAIREARSTAPR